MSVPKTPLVEAWNLPDRHAPEPADPQAYAEEFVAIMTEILDREHPLPTKINNTPYTDNLTSSGNGPPAAG